MRSPACLLLIAGLLLPANPTAHAQQPAVDAAAAPALPPSPQPAPSPPSSPPPQAPAAAPASPDAADLSKPEARRYRILFQEEIYWYYVFAPRGYRQRPAGPALLLLHGVGGSGEWSINAWQDVANAEGILLVAPTLPAGPVIEAAAPALFRAILAQVRTAWKFDPRRVYVFGHSAGGILAFDAATLDADLFAAAAVHAGIITPEYDWILGRAVRKTPIALYIGDRDEFFPLAKARRTRDALLAAGFPLTYVEIPGHSHTFGEIAAQLTRKAWAFLSQHSLPG